MFFLIIPLKKILNNSLLLIYERKIFKFRILTDEFFLKIKQYSFGKISPTPAVRLAQWGKALESLEYMYVELIFQII